MKTAKIPHNSTNLPENPLLRSRIIERRKMRAGELLEHPNNWRVHTLFQKESVKAVLEEYGMIDTLKAYYSPKYKGYVLVNGHLRRDLDHDQVWEVDILDITDEEADDILMFFDRTTGWAQTDVMKLESLAINLSSDSPEILAVASKIRDEISKQVEAAEALTSADEKGDSKPEHNGLKGYDSSYLKIVVHITDQLPVIEQALRETGERGRGDALLAICQFYLDNQ